jgi:hypothetical protein
MDSRHVAVRRPALHRTWRIATDSVRYARSLGVEIGDGCRILGMTAATFGSEPYLIRLGSDVTVTSGVRFITHDGGLAIFRKDHP